MFFCFMMKKEREIKIMHSSVDTGLYKTVRLLEAHHFFLPTVLLQLLRKKLATRHGATCVCHIYFPQSLENYDIAQAVDEPGYQ